MKKLLGSFFQKPKDSSPLSGASLSPQEAAGPVAATLQAAGARRMASPPAQDRTYRTGPRSTWESFFHSPSSSKALASPPQQGAASVLVPEKVFNQNLDMLMREIATKTKNVITKMIEEGEFQAEFAQLCEFVNLAADKLLERGECILAQLRRLDIRLMLVNNTQGESSLLLLQNYFSSAAGAILCEQTALPSLVLDFVNKVRVYLIKNELRRLHESLHDENSRRTLEHQVSSTTAAELERPIHFMMTCLQAVASTASLMEQFRCEIPTIIQLTAEDYPTSALYLRDISSHVLASIPDKNFNAGLVWYLNDCKTIGRTIRSMARYGEASLVSPESAGVALASLESSTKLHACDPRSPGEEPIAAAVRDALGLNTSADSEPNEIRESAVPHSVGGEMTTTECQDSQGSIHYSLTRTYDPAPGFKSLVYTLQKTCRYSLVLLGEFQSSGGYGLLMDFIKRATESDVPTMIYLATLLLPLGTGFPGICGEDENMATVMTCGARNVGAFMAMRDLVLECISDLKSANEATRRNSLEQLLLQLLTTVLQIYTGAYENFLCLEQKSQALAMILSRLPAVDFFDAQVIILRIVEYVCAAARRDSLLPIEVLAVLCSQFIESSTKEVTNLIETIEQAVITSSGVIDDTHLPEDLTTGLLCDCVLKIIQVPSIPEYKDELRRFGLLDRAVYAHFMKVASSISAHTSQPTIQQAYVSAFKSRLKIWSTIACWMIRGSLSVAVEFRNMQIHQCLYVIVETMVNDDSIACSDVLKTPVLPIYLELAALPEACEADGRTPEDSESSLTLVSGIESDLARFLQLVQREKGDPRRQCFLLSIIRHMTYGRQLFWAAWSTCQGHETLLSILSSLHSMNDQRTTEEDFAVFDTILEILCLTLDPTRIVNQKCIDHFTNSIKYSTLASCLVTSSVMDTRQWPSILNRVFELITGLESPRNKVRNPDAVEALFDLLPHMSASQREQSLQRLLSKIAFNDDLVFSRKKQAASLVKAGVFRWLAQPGIIAVLKDESCPSQRELVRLIVEVSREEFSTCHLREYLRVIALGMPLLLGNHYHPKCSPSINSRSGQGPHDTEEIGFRLLRTTLNGSSVRQVPVGTNVKTRMTSGYVHVVNHSERTWPPQNGYSFSCWMRFPTINTRLQEKVTSNAVPSTSMVCVALCEGLLMVRLNGDDTESPNTYCVLVGTELSLFESAAASRNSSNPRLTLTVTAVAPKSELEFYVWSHDALYVARIPDFSAESAEMWIRALQQSESISSRLTPQVKASAEGERASEVLFPSDHASLSHLAQQAGLEGFVCLLSVYSLEASGCFMRVYFDQTNGCLRVDTGSAMPSSNVHPSSKRTTAVFKNVSVDLLRTETFSESSGDIDTQEKMSHWHHLAVTHKKSALGNSQITLYIDGAEVAKKKLTYPSSSAPGPMQAFIGKDIQVCGAYPALPWHLGPAWLVGDVLPINAIICIFLLGPGFRGQFGGHAYRSIGDWPEAIATSQLDRATKRRVEVLRAARRAQLSRLGKAARRQWCDSASSSSDTQVANVFTDLLTKKDDQNDSIGGGRSLDKRHFTSGFSTFLSEECSMSVFGTEILEVFSSFKLEEDDIMFSINTSFEAQQQDISNGRRYASQVHFIGTESYTPLDIAKVAPSVGGITQLLLPLIENSWRENELASSLKLLSRCNRRNPSCLAELLDLNGYALIASMLRERPHLLHGAVLKAVVRLAVSGDVDSVTRLSTTSNKTKAWPLIVDFEALKHVVLSSDIRQQLVGSAQVQMLHHLQSLVEPENPNSIFNVRQLRQTNVLSWILTFIADICDNDNSLDQESAMNCRDCFPNFALESHSRVFKSLLDSLTVYIHLESHPHDVTTMAEALLISLGDSGTNVSSPFRAVVLQFLLNETEKAEESSSGTTIPWEGKGVIRPRNDGAEPFATVVVESVILADVSQASKKKKDRLDGALHSLASPASGNVVPSQGRDSSGNNLDFVLCEVIRRTENVKFAKLEALLATRIMLSLAQTYTAFARQLFQTGPLGEKFKAVLRRYSSDCDFYTPILAIISNTPIRETKYHDPVVNSDSSAQFALPSPRGFEHIKDNWHLEPVWELLGSMLLENCRSEDEMATRVTIAVLNQLTAQIELSEAFFGTVRHTSFVFLRFTALCLIHGPSQRHSSVSGNFDSTQTEFASDDFIAQVNAILMNRPPASSHLSRLSACVKVVKAFATRSLFESNDFSMNMMYLLELMDDEIRKLPARSASDGQRCWLAVMVHVVKHTKALSDSCSLLVLKNLATVSMALSRYLVDQTRHQVSVAELARPSLSSDLDSVHVAVGCFGTDILIFILSIIRMCGETHIGQIVGVEDQQFFYGCFVYCAQAILLSELNGAHTSASPPARLLDCLLNSKHYFVQQNKVAGVIVCGVGHQHHPSAEADGPAPSGASNSRGLNAHLSKMKSLTISAFHKEFGIGAESDRSFLLSLAAELLRWLVDDFERVRHASISMWQFLFQQRMGVLKELLIVEPKVSLLQNMSSTKREAIDVYHGGFDRLLKITLPRTSTDNSSARSSSGELSISHESWLQFHIWLTENYDFLKELILTRTEPILEHMIDVLQSCQVVRKVNSSIVGNRSTALVDLDLDFPRYGCPQQHKSDEHCSVDTPNGTTNAMAEMLCRLAMRRALLKLTNLQDSAIEEMDDARLRWLEVTSNLHNTRAIWATRTSDDADHADDSRASCGTRRDNLPNEQFYLQRSVFQRNDCSYRLDFTEGPLRMRVRIIKRVSSRVRASDSHTSSHQPERMESTGPDPLQLKLEFHKCVEAFHDFMFKRSKSLEASDVSAKRSDLDVLSEVAAECNVDRVKNLLQDISGQAGCTDYVTAVAARIYSEYLEGVKALALNVTEAVAEGILETIASARDSSELNPVSSTVFDLADFEAVRATLNIGVSRSHRRTNVPTEELNDSDQDEDEDFMEKAAMKPPHTCDSEDSSSEDDNENVHEIGGPQCHPPTEGPADRDKTRTGGCEDHNHPSESEALFDTSTDYVYGGIARFLNRGDYPPQRSFNGAYVVGMTKTAGVFLVCKTAVYFVGSYTKVYGDSSRGTCGDSTVACGTLSPVSPSKPRGGKKKAKDIIRETFADIGLSLPGSKTSQSAIFTIVALSSSVDENTRTKDASTNIGVIPADKWSIKYSDMKQFYRVKYQLRPVGIEFFNTSGSTFFMHFDSVTDREEIVKLLFQMPIVNSIFWNPLLRSSALSLSVKRIRQALTKRWLKGGISNFEYLIHLNTLAGRSFNDITQYPVFPWVLADYSSHFLDYSNPATYRDLSKPMGAIGGNRAALFRERFAAMNYDAAHTPMDSPAFHYGTHYSCSAYVVNYLIRLEPFSQLARDLQGGSFDHADRLFRSIPSSWQSASTENLQDVRELVPEFFFLPEFLYNANNYDLGVTQGGEVVSHVKLPAWAHGDPREYIRLHRCALESKFVSENLHHWIDLIFGYKQSGAAALEAQNVFMHFTYEGAVDLDSIEDPVMRNAMLAQIENFGQTPSKLFAAPHPARKVPSLISQLSTPIDSSQPTEDLSGIGQPYDGNTISSVESFIKWHTPLAPALVSIGKDYVFLKKLTTTTTEGPVGDVQIVGDRILSRGIGCTFAPPKFTKFLDWGSAPDGTMKLRVHNSSARHREANKIVGIIEGAHHSRVYCAAFSDDGVTLVSGGEDAVVNILECRKIHGRRQFKQIAKLVGHEDAVMSVGIERTFNIIASGCRDGRVILWDLRTRTFLRELEGYSGSIVAVGINRASGNIVACTSSELRLWSINGDLLAATTIQSVGLSFVTCALSTKCENWQNGVFVATGHSNGTIALWGLSFPSDIAAERDQRGEAGNAQATLTPRSGTTSSSATLRTAVKIGVAPPDHSLNSTMMQRGQTVLKVIPSCHFAIKKLLVDHRSAITALAIGPEQRQLISGDADGHCIRWVDDSISMNAI